MAISLLVIVLVVVLLAVSIAASNAQKPAMHNAHLPQARTGEGSSQATVRRLYFYLVALISSTAGLFAFVSLAFSLVDVWFARPGLEVISGPGFQRTTIASNAGLLVVTTPIFLLHWALIQARAARAEYPEERTAALRKFFLYFASAIALGLLLAMVQNLVSGVAQLAFGQPIGESKLLPASWLQDLIAIGASGALLWYWQTIVRRDGDFGLEEGLAAVWRRLFLAGVIIAGLTMILFGSASIISAAIQWGIDRIVPSITRLWFAPRLGDGLALMLIGIVVARTGLQVWHAVVEGRPAEEQSALLRLFLYVTAVGGAVATLVPAALVLRALLIWTFAGFNRTPLEMLDMISGPLAFLPAGVAIWWRFWSVIQAMEARTGVRAEGATVRRIYFYAVAATGLVLLWIGLVNIVQVILDALLTTRDQMGNLVWEQPLANGLSLLVVGAPVWALHWRAVQGVARLTDADGAAERASLPRRIYLYGVAFAGAILILYYLAQVIYRVFLVIMGDRSVALLSPELAEDLARSAIAALLWSVHLIALRADGRFAPDAEAAADPEVRRAQLDAQIVELETGLKELRAERDALVGKTPLTSA